MSDNQPPDGSPAIPFVLNDAVKAVREQLGAGKRICILGETEFHEADSEELVKAVAKQLEATFGAAGVFITCGKAGVQKVFAESCGDGSRVWNLLPHGQASGYGVGKDIQAGQDLAQRGQIFGRLGDIYITVEGGQGVAEEARSAFERGALVLPLVRTGGASEGMFDFPSGALLKPSFATREQWALLGDQGAPLADSAAAVIAIAASAAGVVVPPAPSTSSASTAPKLPSPKTVDSFLTAEGPVDTGPQPVTQTFSLADDDDADVEDMTEAQSPQLSMPPAGSDPPAPAAAKAPAAPAVRAEAAPSSAPSMPVDIQSEASSVAGSIVAESDETLGARVRDSFQWLCLEDQKTVCRRECDKAKKREAALLKQLQQTVDAYVHALEVCSAVGDPGDGRGLELSPEVREKYQERIRFIKGTITALQEEPNVSLPPLSAIESAKGLVFSSYAQTAQSAKWLGDSTGTTGSVVAAASNVKGALASLSSRWSFGRGGTGQQ
eukprot:gnl/TRDRNA2_/TRDRNA2_162094_c0_seq1.p1 gnl/TRDRNA2_/TRDRNA2_162094_c0~~gnl/TRDRNA2_/TRDRNA2_162094_c0_seq1.p1  ORF type:complete len:495 (-),score=85.61 gnl/TRDRNA2_/TRDRNA2_162094_c0_seq1:113-1597(-)